MLKRGSVRRPASTAARAATGAFEPVAKPLIPVFPGGGVVVRIDAKALALAVGLLWGGAILAFSLVAMFVPGYGSAVLELAASIYPGYDGASGLSSTLVGTLYGLVDGAIGGWLLGWLYNHFAV